MQRHAGLQQLCKASVLISRSQRSHLLQLLAYDGSGMLYAYGADHELRSISVREQLLGAADEAEATQGSAERQQLRVMRAEPALPCAAEHLHINRAGTYALVYGHMASERENGPPALHVISLTQRDDEAAALPLEDAQLIDRPGLQILQASWHPSSDVHFAVLGSDNVFRLYHIDDLSSPEQQVELRLRERQPLGLTDMEGSQAAAFAFGSLHLWERFAVFFACADGRNFVLVPFVPFGCALATSALHRLHAHTETIDDAPDRSSTRAWLQRAFPASPEGNGNDATDSVACRPAALDEHAPALQGPLPLEAPGGAAHSSLLDFLEGDQNIVTCATLGCTGAVGCIALGTAGSTVAVLAFADALQPRWAPQPPQAHLDDRGQIARVRQQAVRRAARAPRLLLIDVVQLQVDSEAEEAMRIQLLPSPAESDSLYAATCRGVIELRLPWLPRVAALAGAQEADSTDRSPLPPTSVQEVCVATSCTTGACVLGDALLGTAVVACEADGSVQCLASAARTSAQLLGQQHSLDDAVSPAASPDDPDIGSTVDSRFGQLLRQPDAGGIVPAAPRYSGTADGQRALADAVAALRKRYVEFAHTGHHDLLQHAKRLQGNAADQERQLATLQQQAAQLAQADTAHEQQLKRAVELHSNLDARFQLLASLHWSLPQPMSAAESTLLTSDLPALERIAADLQRKCQDAAGRVDALQEAPTQPAAQNIQQVAALPPAQVRRVRGALAEQAAVLAANRAKAQVVSDCLAAVT